MDSDSDDGSLLFVPAALQSNPTTPTRLSVGDGSCALKCTGDASHFQPYFEQNDASGSKPAPSVAPDGLQAFPRPRDSVDGAGSVDGDKNLAADSRIERRKQNQYKRHGSLTLAWQQRLSSSRDPRTRLSSEIDSHADPGSPIPTPAYSSWYRPNRNSGGALPTGRDKQETMRRLDSQQSAGGPTQRQSRWRSGSLATVSPATTTTASLAYGFGGSKAGSSLFAPVNNYHVGSSSASQLYQSGYKRNGGGHSNNSSISTSSYETSNRGPGATRTGDNVSSDYAPVRTSYGYGTI
ncbi:hypothetical protein GGI21_006353, partial [Coemansia aciculifera]